MLEISDNKLHKLPWEEKVYAFKTINNPRRARNLARWIISIIVVIFVGLFLPWQQNVSGSGEITALTPQDRPQDVNSAIPGRIKEWRVKEGDYVKENDTLVVLSEVKTEYFDPEILDRLQEQLNAKSSGIDASKSKINALQNLITARQTGLILSLQKARNKYQQALLKVDIDSANLQAEKLNLAIAKRQFESYDELYQAADPGELQLISRTSWEKRQQKLQEVEAKVVAATNKYLVSQNELINARIQLNSIEADYADKIAKAQSDLNSSQASLADKEESFSKLTNYYSNVNIRTQQYYVLAPQSGYVVKTLKSGVGETIKENEAICTIQPDFPQVAAEVYVNANDVPLLSIGRKVRLEFDGWPALQVSGWPSVAVGTFGGIIKVIDLVDSKNGKYRVLVVPDPEEPWPQQLRVGSGVYGWVLLDDVRVWYEVWRQLNGFPPSLYAEPDEGEDKAKKSDQKIKIKVK